MDRRLARTRGNSWPNRLIKYLADAEERAKTLNEKDLYSFCRRLVSLALDGWPDPYVAAFYYQYGNPPNKVIPEWRRCEEKDRRMEIPDYDPLSDPLCKVRIPPPQLGLMYQMSASGWPAEPDSLPDASAEEFAGQPEVSRPGTTSLAWPVWKYGTFCHDAKELEARRLYMKEYGKTHRALLRSLRDASGYIMCIQCRDPVCYDSKYLCAFHLQRARASWNACYDRKRLAMGKTVQRGKFNRWRQEAPPPLLGLS